MRAVYCHYDGYLAHNGIILLEFFTDPNKLAKLITSDISSFDRTRIDREDNTRVCTFASYDKYRKTMHLQEYNYILRNDGIWYVFCSYKTEDYVPLAAAINLETLQHAVDINFV